MRTLRLWIAYDGTEYAGWQRQANGLAVQEVVERAVSLLTGRSSTVHGAGRTDSGVHAFAQSAHVRVERGPPTEAFHKALNTTLPPDVRVLGAREVPAAFHARFSARGKRYLYRVRTHSVQPAIGRGYCHWNGGIEVDVEAMRTAKRALIGKHDFASFATNTGNERQRPTVRTIQSLHVRRHPQGFDVVVQGDGFLYNMVRTLAGTLLEVGRGRRSPGWVGEVLDARDRRAAGPTLPPQGLFLVRVLYPAEFGPDRAPGSGRR